MSVYVVDASVAAKWFFEESHTEAASAILDAHYQLHAPDFLRLELDSVIGKRIRRGEITASLGRSIRDALRAFPLQYHPADLLEDAVFELALETSRSVYDCLYLALAVLIEAPLITADRRFYNALETSPLSTHLCWVEALL